MSIGNQIATAGAFLGLLTGAVFAVKYVTNIGDGLTELRELQDKRYKEELEEVTALKKRIFILDAQNFPVFTIEQGDKKEVLGGAITVSVANSYDDSCSFSVNNKNKNSGKKNRKWTKIYNLDELGLQDLSLKLVNSFNTDEEGHVCSFKFVKSLI